VNEKFWVCDRCHSLNDLRHKRCYRCHAERSKASTSEIGEGPKPPRDPSMFTALIVGLIAVVITIYLWSIFESGITMYRARFAGIVGAIVAVAVIVGGRGRVSLGILILSVALTVVTMFAGEYLVASAELALRSPEALDGRIPIADPKDVAAYVIERNGDDPIRPLLWIVAVLESLAVPWAAFAGTAVQARGAFRRRQVRGDDDD
jgi:hypothetical protein